MLTVMHMYVCACVLTEKEERKCARKDQSHGHSWHTRRAARALFILLAFAVGNFRLHDAPQISIFAKRTTGRGGEEKLLFSSAQYDPTEFYLQTRSFFTG